MGVSSRAEREKMFEKGKTFERMRRKATGLSLKILDRVAGLPNR